jgi:hypothetical protein
MQTDGQWDQVEAAVTRMLNARESQSEVDFGQFLPSEPGQQRRLVLITLIKIDLEHRWATGEQRLLETYLQDWPELQNDPDALAELLRAECRIRAAHGALPAASDVQARFPQLPCESLVQSCENDSRTGLDLLHDSTLSRARQESVAGAGIERRRSPALPVGTQLGRYRIVAEIGRGGMGAVYQAHDDELNRTVAIKVLHPWVTVRARESDLLLNEAQAAARLQHPAVVPVHDIGRCADETRFLVMEYVPGNSLARLLKDGRVDQEQILKLLIDIADALHVAHQQGLVHRDIKPANLLVDRQGRARITDFGLAIEARDDSREAGEVAGTLPYMAPEQVRGDAHLLDGRTDVWALGVVLHEALAGSRPFPGDSPEELRRAILTAQPQPLRDVRPRIARDVQRICQRCLAKDPAIRYASAAELAAALRNAQTARRASRRRWIGISACLAAVGVLIFAVLLPWWLTRKRPFVPPAFEEQAVAPWLEDCKLVLTAQTGARIDLDAAETVIVNQPAVFAMSSPLSLDRSRVTGTMVVERRIDHLCLELPLAICWPEDGYNAVLAPEQCSLRLRVDISAKGDFQLGTLGDEAREHLLALVGPGGIDNGLRFDGTLLPAELVGQPHFSSLDLDDKQNILAAWFQQLYTKFATSGAASGGPANHAELYTCPIRLRNRFRESVTVVQGCLYHEQMDYPNYPELRRYRDEAMNAVWSPIAGLPDQDAHLESSFDLRCAPGCPSVLTAAAVTDNDNGSAFELFGLSLDELPGFRRDVEHAWINIDAGAGTCEGGNELVPDRVVISRAWLLLYDQAPTRVELHVDTTWSSSWPYFRYVTLGEVEILSSDWSPKGQEARDITPQVWVIPPDPRP